MKTESFESGSLAEKMFEREERKLNSGEITDYWKKKLEGEDIPKFEFNEISTKKGCGKSFGFGDVGYICGNINGLCPKCRENKVYPDDYDEKEKKMIKELVIARIRAMPENLRLSVG